MKARKMKRKKQWILIYLKDKNPIVFKKIEDLIGYIDKSSTFIYKSIDKRIIRQDKQGNDYILTTDINADLSKYQIKKKQLWYVHYKEDNAIEAYPTIYRLSQAKKIPRNALWKIYTCRWIYSGFAINRSKQIEWDKYHSIDADNPPLDEEPKINSPFYLQQDFYANVERGIPCFDSVTGINKEKYDRYKPSYRLSDEEAKIHNLVQIFPNSRLWIDKTKHIYIKDQNGYYYQLIMT